MAKTTLDAAGLAVSTGSPYNDTSGAQVSDIQTQLKANLASLNTMMTDLMGTNSVSWGSAAPTTGTHARGDIRWNTEPSAGGHAGWRCTIAGTPGTWKQFGVIEN